MAWICLSKPSEKDSLFRSQWIDKSTAYLLLCQINANGPARSGLTNPLHRYLAHCAIVRAYGLDMSIQAERKDPSPAHSGLTNPLHTYEDGLDMAIQAEQTGQLTTCVKI